jgi:hypothetical protein
MWFIFPQIAGLGFSAMAATLAQPMPRLNTLDLVWLDRAHTADGPVKSPLASAGRGGDLCCAATARGCFNMPKVKSGRFHIDRNFHAEFVFGIAPIGAGKRYRLTGVRATATRISSRFPTIPFVGSNSTHPEPGT